LFAVWLVEVSRCNFGCQGMVVDSIPEARGVLIIMAGAGGALGQRRRVGIPFRQR
jgi:hypothetical protein